MNYKEFQELEYDTYFYFVEPLYGRCSCIKNVSLYKKIMFFDQDDMCMCFNCKRKYTTDLDLEVIPIRTIEI